MLTCIGDGKGEHFPGVFELLPELPEDIAFPFSCKPVLSLGGIHDVHYAEGVGDVHVSVDGKGHHSSGWLAER